MLARSLGDLRYALRGLRRSPAFAAGAVLVLAISIGVNLAVFTIADASLFKGFTGIRSQERIVYLTTGRDCCISYPDLRDWRAASRSFEGMAAVADLRVSIETAGAVETATATEVTANLFRVIGAPPAAGRDFELADDQPGAAAVAIISDAFVSRHFNDTAGALGRTVTINGAKTVIIGVMPPGFTFPQNQDVWLPIGPRVHAQPRNGRGLWFGVGRLAPGVTFEQARAEMADIGAELEREYPATNAGVRPMLQTFRDFFIGANALALFGAMWAGVGLLLAIACANLVNLLTARAAGRTREAGVRLALGAGRGRVVRTQLFESTALSCAGGAIGWWLASMLVRGYASVVSPPTQPWAAQLVDYSIDAKAVAYLIAISILTGVVTGIWPALRISRLDVQSVLRDGGRGAIGRRDDRRAAGAIIATQVAMAVILLCAASLLVRSFWVIESRDQGYDSSRVAVAFTSLPPATYPNLDSQFAFRERLAAIAGETPGVSRVAFIDGIAGQSGGRVGIEIEGYPIINPRPQVRQVAISPGYFQTLGRNVVAGRDFDDRDQPETLQTVIVSDRFASLYLPGADAIGHRMRVVTAASAERWLTIVGIAPNLRQADRLRSEIDPAFYRPLRQRPSSNTWLLARTEGDPRALIAPLRRDIQAVDPSLPIWLGPFTLDEWNASSYWKRGLNGGLFAASALLALLVSCLGLFAVTATTVVQRQAEIAVRMALGATAADIVKLVVSQGAIATFVGVGAGLGLSFATNRLLAAQLVDIGPWDPVTFAAVTVIMLATAMCGCLVPALRAIRFDPLVSMRAE